MIESVLKYTSENVGEFVKYNIFGKSKASKVYVICYLVAMALIGAVGIVLAIVTQMWWFIFATVICTLLIVATGLVLSVTLKKYTKEIFDINSKNGYDAIEITASSIVLKNSGAAKAVAEWTAVASVDFYKSSAYIVTHDGYLFIINESDIKEGSLDELRQIADEKLVKADD
ncbi:uncharacterized protein BN788_01750 [[Eubacterium] siraeum CAG:80]|uniref:YcxB-like protein domain-containing protein n=1 Tax=[Eubacterium] siraeum CAG:80 TaxID=1263080 RepID=R6R9F8_9FIRM|nr:uncharacterized protein BN788_01750 [[Eubacterium] siraeum CAG:80]